MARLHIVGPVLDSAVRTGAITLWDIATYTKAKYYPKTKHLQPNNSSELRVHDEEALLREQARRGA